MQRQNQRRVMFATSLGHCMTHLYMLAFPALITPLRAEFQLSLADVLELSFLAYLLYGLCALPAGFITDRWSARWMLVLCLSISGIGSILVGLSPSPTALTFSLAMVGIGAGIYHPTGMALISRTFSERRGWALGINGVFGNIGLASAPFIAGLLASFFGWRWAFLLLGGPGLLGATAIAARSIDEPRAAHLKAKGQTDKATGEPSMKRYFALLCVAMTAGGLAYRASSVIMPTYFEAKAHFLQPFMEATLARLGGSGASTASATTLTSLVYLLGIVGQMIGGRIADRYDLRLSYLAFHLATLPALMGIAYFTEVPLILCAMIYLLFNLGTQPIENSLVARLTPDAWRSTAYGFKFILTFGIGAFAIPLVGFVEKSASLSAVFVVIGGIEVLLVLIATTLWLTSRRRVLRLGNA